MQAGHACRTSSTSASRREGARTVHVRRRGRLETPHGSSARRAPRPHRSRRPMNPYGRDGYPRSSTSWSLHLRSRSRRAASTTRARPAPCCRQRHAPPDWWRRACAHRTFHGRTAWPRSKCSRGLRPGSGAKTAAPIPAASRRSTRRLRRPRCRRTRPLVGRSNARRPDRAATRAPRPARHQQPTSPHPRSQTSGFTRTRSRPWNQPQRLWRPRQLDRGAACTPAGSPPGVPGRPRALRLEPADRRLRDRRRMRSRD